MRTIAIILSALAFLVTITTAVSLVNAPMYQHMETTLTAGGQQETTQTTATLLEVNGRQVVVQFVVVALVSGIPFFVILKRSTSQRLLTWISALLLLAYSIAGSFTIGLFFMPGALLLLITALITFFISKDTDRQVVESS